MEKRVLTTVKIDRETFLLIHEVKPVGMPIAFFIRRSIMENKEIREKARKLEAELEESRRNFTQLALQRQEGVRT